MKFVHGAQYWRSREMAARRVADTLHDPELKRIILGMAAAFGALAMLSTEWEKRSPPDQPGGAS